MQRVPVPPGARRGDESVMEESASAVLGSDGLFSKAIEGFKPRQPQMEMADAVAEAIEKRSVLVAEAGTGTGKTYAYRVPAFFSSRRRHTR